MSAPVDIEDRPDGSPSKTSRLVLALAALLALTALEVIVVGLPVDRAARITALVGLSMTKALVLLAAFMRLGRAPRMFRFAILAPAALATAFAVALMLDAAFRVTLR
jgi:hypothetical protein